MPDVVDFYQYKYSRSNYYINLVFEKEKIKNIKKSIEDGFDDLFINKEEAIKNCTKDTLVVVYTRDFILFPKTLIPLHCLITSGTRRKDFLRVPSMAVGISFII
mgnify:CR=1 FL=1